MVTLKDVATRAGVSVASVSTVINGTATVSPAMRKRVESAVVELGYVPHALARDLRLGRTSTVGLVVPDITNPHFSSLASVIEEACDEAGYTLTLCSTTDDAAKEVRQLQVLRRQRAAGVIFVPGGSPTHDTASLAQLLDRPAVLLDRVLPGLALQAVVLDNVEAGRLAARHLLQQGHRRIAIVAGRASLGISQDRVSGVLRAIAEAGLDPQRASVLDGGFQVELSYFATLQLLDGDVTPTGIVAASSHATVGVMRALAQRGLRCPTDVSVVGIDDFVWAEAFLPRLTVVAQPVTIMGRLAVRLLLEERPIDHTSRQETIVLQPNLIVRESTKTPCADQ